MDTFRNKFVPCQSQGAYRVPSWYVEEQEGQTLLSEDRAERLQRRIVKEVTDWHAQYRQGIREERTRREEAMKARRPTDPPPAPVQDAMIGLQGTSDPR